MKEKSREGGKQRAAELPKTGHGGRFRRGSGRRGFRLHVDKEKGRSWRVSRDALRVFHLGVFFLLGGLLLILSAWKLLRAQAPRQWQGEARYTAGAKEEGIRRRDRMTFLPPGPDSCPDPQDCFPFFFFFYNSFCNYGII